MPRRRPLEKRTMSFFGDFRIGLAGAPHIENGKRSLDARACNLANGDLYGFPNTTTPVIDATQPITFTWNTDCSMASTIDLYLYAPSATNGIAHAWTGVTYSSGKFQTSLQPKWWNSTENAVLQLAIINSGSPMWATTSPAGPVFKVHYPLSAMMTTTAIGGSIVTTTYAAAAVQSTDAVFENVSNVSSSSGIPKGAIAAAVIVPILVLAAIAGVAVRFWRSREAEKRRRWSQAMSSHSNLEWEKGALPGDKPQSILGRPSFSSFGPGGPRAASMATSSIYATENMAGAGAGIVRGQYAQYASKSADNLGQGFERLSVAFPESGLGMNTPGTPGGAVRQSRISFAETARPDRRSRLSLGENNNRATVTSGVWKLPFGSRSATDLATPNRNGGKQTSYASGSAIADDDEDINISPSQLQGPQAFAEAEMRRLGVNKQRTGRKSMLSIGGGRRDSTASHLSADDFKSAASARGSVDELRDIENVMLMRRSMLSQNSANKSSPDLSYSNPGTPNINSPHDFRNMDSNAAETLDHDHQSDYALPAVPPPAANAATVAYGPDQMLAVYAARAKAGAGSPVPPSTSASVIPPAAKKQGIRMLTGLGVNRKVVPTDEIAQTPTGEMKSYVHLNKGTVSSAAVDALPPPGPPTPSGSTSSGSMTGTLRVPGPMGRNRSGTMTMHSDTSNYSDDGDVGQAK